MAAWRLYIFTRLYPLNEQCKRLIICNSRKVAKTDYITNGREKKEREEG